MYRRDIPEQRKEQLINAAFETINVVGLAGVTLSQVAKEAGLSTGIVSHYFGDKEGLLSATMRKILRDLRDAVAECRAQAASDSQSQLFAIIGATSTPAKPTPCPCAPGSISGPPACTSRCCAACSAPTIGDSIPTFAASSAASCRCGRRVMPRAGWRQ